MPQAQGLNDESICRNKLRDISLFNVHFLGPTTLDLRALENGQVTLDIHIVRRHLHLHV